MVSLSGEQRGLVSVANEIAENEFAEKACTWGGETPWENAQFLAEQGFMGTILPEEYGGAGLSHTDAVYIIETIGRVCPDTAYMMIHTDLVCKNIAKFGTEAAKEKYLPPVTRGEDRIALAISESEAGSDVNSMKSHVGVEDGELVLNGEKTWTSHVNDSSAALVWCKFPEGLGLVIVEFDWPGVQLGTEFTNMSGEDQYQWFMNDVVIPEENVVVRGQEELRELFSYFNLERVMLAVQSNCIALCAFDKAMAYSQEREQFGQKIGDFQGIEWKLADMATQIQSSRAMAFNAANTTLSTDINRMDASIAKLHATTMGEEVTSEALQIHGATGYQQGHPLEYLYRLARGRRIAGGTDGIQKNMIIDELKDGGIPSLTKF